MSYLTDCERSFQGVYDVCVSDCRDEGAEVLLAELGKHKLGKACLYLKRLSDVQMPVLEMLLARAVAETKRRYPTAPQ